MTATKRAPKTQKPSTKNQPTSPPSREDRLYDALTAVIEFGLEQVKKAAAGKPPYDGDMGRPPVYQTPPLPIERDGQRPSALHEPDRFSPLGVPRVVGQELDLFFAAIADVGDVLGYEMPNGTMYNGTIIAVLSSLDGVRSGVLNMALTEETNASLNWSREQREDIVVACKTAQRTPADRTWYVTMRKDEATAQYLPRVVGCYDADVILPEFRRKESLTVKTRFGTGTVLGVQQSYDSAVLAHIVRTREQSKASKARRQLHHDAMRGEKAAVDQLLALTRVKGYPRDSASKTPPLSLHLQVLLHDTYEFAIVGIYDTEPVSPESDGDLWHKPSGPSGHRLCRHEMRCC